ncbi:MAG TPA: carboxypeptidase M32 [Levilinea sp.]|nr:carboxypeptidase M32 [Levilinea sp.]
MEEKLSRLKSLLNDTVDLGNAIALLGWDQQTYMPAGGAEDRGNTIATLSRLTHEKFTSEEMGRLIDELLPYADTLQPNSIDACLVRVARERYDKQTRVPAEWVSENAKTTTIAHQTWEKARADKNFELFRPHLEKIIDLRRRYAGFFQPYDHVYDPLLDNFERGMKTAEVQAIFNELRPKQVDIIRAIAERPQVDDTFLHQSFPEKDQWNFGVDVITRFGYDWNHGRQDKAVHPFCTNFGIGDVRITTRVDANWLNPALFGTMHETGHALYEMGIDRSLARLPLANGASMAVHESQSRMYENLIGRSLPFWKFTYPRLQVVFPSQFGNVPLETFYKGINKVQPSFIRVEADEATYNLHIMLRLELEIAMMEGSLEAVDLPEAWNSRVREYLGVSPPDDALGVLQDVHWSSGLIGYFPTYALGNLVSVQLWETMQAEMPDLEEQIERGEFSGILAWLREKVHRHGMKYPPQELIQRVTGSKINPQPYLRYLEAKFSAIYEI